MKSEKLGNQRDVLVWLPPSYREHPDRRYPTLYLQDGQAVFDSDPRYGDTKVGADSWAAKLIAEKALAEVILVAADCSADRDQEYSPAIRGQDYLEFITNELKPRIDVQYRTLLGPENTGIGGWSLGAFITLYAAWQRPDVFGRAACLSTCYFDCPTANDDDMVMPTYRRMLGARDFVPGMRVYLDYGTCEHLDGDISQPGPGQTEALIAAFEQSGLTAETNYLYHLEADGRHTLEDWRARFYRPLAFLFPT